MRFSIAPKEANYQLHHFCNFLSSTPICFIPYPNAASLLRYYHKGPPQEDKPSKKATSQHPSANMVHVPREPPRGLHAGANTYPPLYLGVHSRTIRGLTPLILKAPLLLSQQENLSLLNRTAKIALEQDHLCSQSFNLKGSVGKGLELIIWRFVLVFVRERWDN